LIHIYWKKSIELLSFPAVFGETAAILDVYFSIFG
jgi:hypothetical protein